MSVSTYAFVNARIGGMKSRLLEESELRALMESRNIEELLSQLKNAQYELDSSNTNVLSIELQLKKNLFHDYLKLTRFVKGRPSEFIHSMAKRFEVETLKSLIKLKSLKVNLPEYIIPFGKINQDLIEDLLKADDVVSLIEKLRGTEYFRPLRKIHQKDENPLEITETEELSFENALDNYYFQGVKEAMGRLSKTDKNMIKRFVGFNIDLSNLLTALRLRGVEEDKNKFYIGGGDTFKLNHFNQVAGLEKLEWLPEVVPQKFKELINTGLQKFKETNSLLAFEVVAKKQLLRASRKLFLGSRFHIGTLVAYLNLKENEISNLIKLIKTKDEFFDTKEIENLLVFV